MKHYVMAFMSPVAVLWQNISVREQAAVWLSAFAAIPIWALASVRSFREVRRRLVMQARMRALLAEAKACDDCAEAEVQRLMTEVFPHRAQ